MKLGSIPERLEILAKPPKELFYRGDPALLERRKVAIVGSRRAGSYAKNMTFSLAKALHENRVAVVSGAAMGIDAFAHKGGFPDTIAVMGNSLDLRVPSVNKGLIESIEKEGLTLSEYPATTHPTRYTFVERNRIVVALSEAVVLSEADLDSGTMRSAEIAIKLGVPLYVLSHRVGESLGTQYLLETGKAKVIISVEAFLAELGFEKKGAEERDELLLFCAGHPSYEETVAKFKERLFEYELLGKVEVVNGRVIPL